MASDLKMEDMYWPDLWGLRLLLTLSVKHEILAYYRPTLQPVSNSFQSSVSFLGPASCGIHLHAGWSQAERRKGSQVRYGDYSWGFRQIMTRLIVSGERRSILAINSPH